MQQYTFYTSDQLSVLSEEGLVLICSSTLSFRVLREEWEKREELERLQDEQKILLEQEREKRMEFEKKQREKEAQLLGNGFE